MSAVVDVKSDGYIEELVHVRRVAKVVKGGRIFGFSALVVVGDGHRRVGIGIGKSREVPAAIQKATEAAKRNMITIELNNDTLFHEVKAKHGSSMVFMKPASEGTGIIAGSAMRSVFNVIGVKNVLAKVVAGSSNPINVVRATLKALTSIHSPDWIAAKRGKSVQEIWREAEHEQV
jgi:small subunit ribosomal protein S5